MSHNINLKKGLNIPIKGIASLKTKKTIVPGIIAVKPTDFKGLCPRLLVKVGDRVLAGSPILADKQNPEILITSAVSGVIENIIRGEKRKLMAVLIKADNKIEYIDFEEEIKTHLQENGNDFTKEKVQELLLKSGLWACIKQRPYGVLARPDTEVKSIFISGLDTSPLAADIDYCLAGEIMNIQTGINALAKLTSGDVHLCIPKQAYNNLPLHKIKNALVHTVKGVHPAGNVGVQISHIDPIQKGETVWTISLHLLAVIGKFLNKGKVDLRRKVAITGPEAIDPAYVDTYPGFSMKALSGFYYNVSNDIRFISGDCLCGENIGMNGYLGFFDNQVCLMHEGKEREILGWAKPFRFNTFSASRAYFSWLMPKRLREMNTNTNGGPRAFVMNKLYEDVLPMDIFPIQLIKACLAKDIEKMEQLGIYEVIPEDLALCEYVDPSKNDIQMILQEGIDLMIQEMS